jgi:hypothetical protein
MFSSSRKRLLIYLAAAILLHLHSVLQALAGRYEWASAAGGVGGSLLVLAAFGELIYWLATRNRRTR